MCVDFFVFQVDSVNRDGVLLEMVQLLTDLDLVISKSYISSDGGWLMDGKNFFFSLFLFRSSDILEPSVIFFFFFGLVGIAQMQCST